MKYAIAQLGGKQVKICEGATFKLERQKDLKFDVLLFSEDSKVLIGTPYLKNINVSADIVGEERTKKIRVARFKSKSRYRKVKGHRQPISVITIKKIQEVTSKQPAAKKSKNLEEKK